MKIFFLASWFPSHVVPNHGNFVARHARLVARDHEVTVVHIQDDPSLRTGKLRTNVFSESGYRVVQVFFGQSGIPKFLRLFVRFWAWRRGLRYARQAAGKPDLLHAHVLLDAGIVAWLWGKHWRLPHLLTEHSTAYHEPGALPGLRGWLGKKACAAAAIILPVSRHLAISMQRINHLKGRYRVISNVVDSDLYNFSLPPEGRFKWLHVSNFVEDKNVPGILRAFKKVSKKLTDRQATLHLAGDGDFAALSLMITEVGLKNVTTSGPHTEEEIAGLMANCHAFVLFSNYENQPVVLLEAQCCGRPCLSTPVGGIPDIVIPGQSGELVPVRDEAALAKAMVEMAANYGKYDQKAIRQRAVSQYAQAAVRKALNEEYERALKQSGADAGAKEDGKEQGN